MRIGVLGGSFDPPHKGHSALAACAFEQLELDLLIVAVAFRQWQKQHDAAAVDRFAMSKLEFAHENWEVSSIDLERGTPTFTIDTIEELQSLYPTAEFIFIVGADAVSTLASWHRATELAARVKFAASARAGRISEVPAGFNVEWLDCLLPDISSTEIRQLLELSSRNLSDMTEVLSPAVLDYISEHGLYQ